MTPEQAVKKVNETWKYVSDGSVDRWSFSTPGDCENYSLRVLMFIKGDDGAAKRSLLRGEAHMWYVKTANGSGHAILEWEGKFVDNRQRQWKDSLDEMDIRETPRRRYSKTELVLKLGVGSLFSLFGF